MRVDDLQESENKRCFHNPGSHLGPFRRFLCFFWNRSKLMDTFSYTSVCTGCGTTLCVPKAFLCTGLKCLYGLMAAIMEFILILIAAYAMEPLKWLYIGQLFVASLSVLMVRCISAAILSFGQWEVQQPLNNVLLRYYNDPVGHKQRTLGIIICGVCLAMMCQFGAYIYAIISMGLSIFSVLIGIITKEKYYLQAGLMIALCDAVLLLIYYAWRSRIVSVIVAGIGFALCFLALYFIYKFQDEHKLKEKGH